VGDRRGVSSKGTFTRGLGGGSRDFHRTPNWTGRAKRGKKGNGKTQYLWNFGARAKNEYSTVTYPLPPDGKYRKGVLRVNDRGQ